MKALVALLALPLIGAAAIPDKPSFACKGRLTPSEKAICGDRELAAWDRAMAKVYRALKDSNEWTARQQATWLKTRNRCVASTACLLRVYRAWPGFSRPAGGVGLVFPRVGTDPANPASLQVMHIYGDWHYVSVSALHIRDAAIGAVNDGSYASAMLLKRGQGTFQEAPEVRYSCRFTLTSTGPRSWTIDQSDAPGQCGGLGVFLDGEYRLP